MAAVLECGADGFDMDDAAAAADLDAAPASPASPARASSSGGGGVEEAKAASAAAHTYDMGYKRWEAFDADAAPATAAAAPARAHIDGLPNAAETAAPPAPAAPETAATKIDFSLPLFAHMPADQHPHVASVLALDEAQLAGLPEDQRATVASFRDAYKKQAADKAAGRTPGRNDAPEQRAEDIDFTLSLFDKMPADQKEYLTQILLLDEKDVARLPRESQDTVKSFRQMYVEQKDIKKRGPAAAADYARKPKTPEEEAAEKEKRKMEHLVKLHAEMEKMKEWDLEAAASEWARVEAARLGALAAERGAAATKRKETVDAAMRDIANAGDAASVGARRVKSAQRKQPAKAKARAKDDRRAQLARLRALAGSAPAGI